MLDGPVCPKISAMQTMNISQALVTASDQLDRGNLEYCEQILSKVLKADPSSADALHLMSMVCYRRGRIDSAIDFNKRASRQAPDNPTLLNNLGNFLKDKGDLAASRQAYERALGMDPTCFPAQYNLALVLSAQGEKEGAIRAFKRARLLKGDYPYIHHHLGLELISAGRAEEAIVSLEKALEGLPGQAGFATREALAGAFYALHRYDRALREYEHLAESGFESEVVTCRLIELRTMR